MEKLRKNRIGYIEGIISIILNLLLFMLKYWAGIVSGSLALIADAWHTLSDSISSLIVIIGVKWSSKKPDKKHPFGHGRIEQIAAIFIGFLLGIIAYEFLIESIHKFNSGEKAEFGTIAIVVTVISIVLKEGLAQYAFWAYRKTGFSTMKADGWHHRSDSLSSIIVLGGILLKDYFWWIDSVLGFVISIMLFYAVFEIVKDAISKLIGEMPEPKLIEDIKIIISQTHHDKLFPHHFHIHRYGVHQELTFHIQVDGECNVSEAHEIATKIERAIYEKLNIIATIHLEPLENQD